MGSFKIDAGEIKPTFGLWISLPDSLWAGRPPSVRNLLFPICSFSLYFLFSLILYVLQGANVYKYRAWFVWIVYF